MNAEGTSVSGLPPPADLRREAEQRLNARTALAERPAAEADVRALLHELQVHQIELEMQNEELLRAQATAQEASEKYCELFDFAPVGYFVWEREGRILEVNLAGAELLGLNRQALVQKRFGEFVAAEHRPAFAAFCKQVLAADVQQQCEIKLLKSGQTVTVLVEGISAQEQAGQERHCCAAVVDITQHKRAKELAAVNRSLQAEIAARERVEQQLFETNQRLQAQTETLLEAKEAAEAANLAKSRFLANMSHDLRTPMNAILGMINVALSKGISPPVSDCLQTVKESASLLLTLLNDLLDSAKIESGRLELELAPFSLRTMLEQTTRVLSVQAAERGLSFSCRMSYDIPNTVVGDRVRLQQVLLNLTANAIKFTERGEVEIYVRVLAREDEGLLEFSVRDTGIGIPPADLERLFQPFTQGDISISRRFGGTGLGLAICKSLVELMGGRIWADSAEGQGSTFFFRVCLPLANELPSDFEAPSVVATASAQLRILLVEDNPANQKLAAYFLRDRGHVIEIAGDGHEAIRMTEQNGYDVVLMDVQMPGLDGLEATAAIRKGEAADCRVPIIAMTAYAQKGDRERCLAAGMDAYVAKPVNREELIEVVERLGSTGEELRRSGGRRRAAETVEATSLEQSARPERSDGSSSAPFDLDEALARLGNMELFRQMVAFLFSDGLVLVKEIQAAAETGDAPAILNKAHRLKGTVLYLGAEPAAQAIACVEALGRSADLTGAAHATRVMAMEVTRLAEALRDYLPMSRGNDTPGSQC